MFGRNVELSFLAIRLGVFQLTEMTDGWLWWSSRSKTRPRHNVLMYSITRMLHFVNLLNHPTLLHAYNIYVL